MVALLVRSVTRGGRRAAGCKTRSGDATSAAQQAVEDRRPRLVVNGSVLPVARGEVPRTRSPRSDRSSFPDAAAA